MIVSDN